MDDNNIIELIDVVKVYKNGVSALDSVSFTVRPGEFVFVVGESGAGKSTLIKLLTREEKANSGQVLLNGYNLADLSQRLVPFLRRKIGMIFQDFRLIEGKTVYENVAFAMEIIGASHAEIKRHVPLALTQVGLRHKSEMYPNELSGGEAQRLGIARAIVNNPTLILADEPTGNLDPVNGEAIMALLECINQEGTTVIACTHDKELVDRMGKRVLEFFNGKLIRDEVHSTYDKRPECPSVLQRKKRGETSGRSLSEQEHNQDPEEHPAKHGRDHLRIPQVKAMQELIMDSHQRRTSRRHSRKDKSAVDVE